MNSFHFNSYYTISLIAPSDTERGLTHNMARYTRRVPALQMKKNSEHW